MSWAFVNWNANYNTWPSMVVAGMANETLDNADRKRKSLGQCNGKIAELQCVILLEGVIRLRMIVRCIVWHGRVGHYTGLMNYTGFAWRILISQSVLHMNRTRLFGTTERSLASD